MPSAAASSRAWSMRPLRKLRTRCWRSEERRVGKEGSTSWWACQAEDGIRDWSVTGVQTCALPISAGVERPPDSRLARAEEHAHAEPTAIVEGGGQVLPPVRDAFRGRILTGLVDAAAQEAPHPLL